MLKGYSDEQLVEFCIRGDDKAWKVFVRRFSKLVFKAIRVKAEKEAHILSNSDINDIYQLVFTGIWKKNSLKRLQNIKTLRAWIVIVAQNTTIDYSRRQKRTNCLSKNIPHCKDYTLQNPRSRAHANQFYKLVEEVIKDFPLKRRRILSLDLLYEFKHREIAQLMGLPLNTVSTIIARSKKEFRRILKEKGYGFNE
ncbi:MAG: sigma-70 family RNA polymerase sigma factor [Candidatus Omnitrophota bacterium]